MSTPWLDRQQHTLVNLCATHNAPVLARGHEPEGVLALIQDYIASALCENLAKPLSPSGGFRPPCQQCPACQMRMAGHHPDFQAVYPQAIALEKGLNVELKTGVKPSQEIRVDDIRQMQAFFNTASSRGGPRFAVLYPFDKINLNAANALLKTLEEPNADLRFFLIGNKVEDLLPTIRSRCQVFNVEAPSPQEALDWLQGRGVKQAEVVLSLAGNDPFEALKLAENKAEELELRRKWVEWLASPELHSQIPPSVEKLGFPLLLELGMRLLQDLTRVHLNQSCEQFPWLAPKLLWARRVGIQGLSDVFALYQKQYKVAQHPLNPRLALEFIAQRWQTLSA